jgi:type III secretion protein D
MQEDSEMSTPDTTAPADSHVLRIVSGLHAGASRGLAGQEMLLVGSGEDCDIVLADAGVASHHALISLLDGRFSLRALDAPLHVGTSMVHPGDPVELASVERVGLGDAALAFGAVDDPAWDQLLPGAGAARPLPPRAATPYMRRLPAVAAVAALSLASLAIFAAVMPAQDVQADPRERLESLIPAYGIDDGRAALDLQENLVLTGTVKDSATRDRITELVAAEGLDARVDLRTGEDIAADVREILRSQGLNARTRYLGNGDVEVSGSFADEQALRAAALSRAMRDVKGVNRVIPQNFADQGEVRAAAAMKAPARPVDTRIVAIVRGKDPHVVAADGNRYPVGAQLPGRGTLISITEDSAHALTTTGELERLKVEPAPAADAEAAPPSFANVKGEVLAGRM